MRRLAWTLAIAFAACGMPGCGSDEGSKGNQGTGGSTGDGCASAADCPRGLLCDPDTRTCVEVECDENQACPAGEVCITQTSATNGGVCYEQCTPFAGECSGDRECYPLTYDNADGICLERGPAGACDANFTSLVSTGCDAGQRCALGDYGGQCLQQCDFFASDPGCPSGTRCTVEGLCADLSVDGSAAGEACSATAKEADFCGATGGRVAGTCLEPPDDSGLSCLPFCRTSGMDCGGGSHFCAITDENFPELGVCVDLGSCGTGGSGDCEACITSSAASSGCCASLSSACSGNVQCSNLLNCIRSCDDDPCLDACVRQNPDGITLLNDLFTCIYGDERQGFLGACGTVCVLEGDDSGG